MVSICFLCRIIRLFCGWILFRICVVYNVEMFWVVRLWVRVMILVWDFMLRLIVVLFSRRMFGWWIRVWVIFVWCCCLFDRVEMCVFSWFDSLISVRILVLCRCVCVCLMLCSVV